MKKRIVRIKDIAERAQTSKGTVDRVLHNRGRVAEDVRERILAIIKELDYEPNFIAQSLKSQRTYHLAVLVPDASLDPYWAAPKAGIEKAEKELRQYGVYTTQFTFDPHDDQSFIARAQEVTHEKPDGLLIAPVFYKEVLPFFKEWQEMGIPYVLFNTQIEHVNPLCYIGQDSYRSGSLVAKILDFGAAKPGTILVAHVNEDISNSAHLMTKEEGFRNHFKNSASTADFNIISREINFPEGSTPDSLLDELMKEYPDLCAVYVTNSKAFEVAAYFERRNIRNIRLVGYDLVEANLHYLENELIQFLINQNPLGQGYWGISQLTNYLVFKKDIAPIKFLPLDIITRENLDYYLDPQ